jgi:hypothetical protein
MEDRKKMVAWFATNEVLFTLKSERKAFRYLKSLEKSGDEIDKQFVKLSIPHLIGINEEEEEVEDLKNVGGYV